VKFDSSLLVVVAIFGVAYFLLKVFLFDRLLPRCGHMGQVWCPATLLPALLEVLAAAPGTHAEPPAPSSPRPGL
jgi:hypothetical protein